MLLNVSLLHLLQSSLSLDGCVYQEAFIEPLLSDRYCARHWNIQSLKATCQPSRILFGV